MGSILAPDDLKVGKYIAVHSAARRAASEAPSEAADESPAARHGQFPAGVPLQVRAVSLPFLVCGVLQPGGGHSGPVVLDLRRVRLIGVNKSFVDAIAGFVDSDQPEGPGSGSVTAVAEAGAKSQA
jgi:hypothetical protein